MSQALEIGTRLVALVREDKESEALDTLYDAAIVSIEGQGSDEMPARLEGMDAIKGKHAWWYGNHEVHSTEVLGPFVGHRDDQFIVQFQIDVTPHGAERNTMTEVGVFTIAGGKIVQEEFLYLMG